MADTDPARPPLAAPAGLSPDALPQRPGARRRPCRPALLLMLALLPGCVETGLPRAGAAHLMRGEDSAEAPPGAPPGACYAEDRTPARLETITEQVLVSAELRGPDGTVTTPASYRTETRQSLTGGGERLLFRTPCAAEMTPELIGTLQRALSARGIYGGEASGRLDGATRQALRRYQSGSHGLDSAILSLEGARSLGLIAWDRDAL